MNLAGSSHHRKDPEALGQLARNALASGKEEAVLAIVAPAAAWHRTNARLWQWTGLLHRALDDRVAALAAFDRAALLAPDDPGIAHGRARVALEAGLPAIALFEKAGALAPLDGNILLGLAAARFASGDGERGVADLTGFVRRNPAWIEGHRQLSQLRALTGDHVAPLRSFEEALAAAPMQALLWQGLVETLIEDERYAAALNAVRRGRRNLGASPWFDANEAIALSELGQLDAADRAFARLAGDDDHGMAVWRVRHLLRCGKIAEALVLIDRFLHLSGSALWPYAAIAWRLTGDPRQLWLEGDPRLVSVVDLTGKLPPLDRLAAVLWGLHKAKGGHIGQSVRGGTQTDGALFALIDPEIKALRAAIGAAVRDHVAQLPPFDPAHPVLGPRRDAYIRFSGSWSVRLSGQGHHANHVHPMGWLSSAFYVALPGEDERGAGQAGWLTLGQPQAALGLDLPPIRMIEPKPGRLVLFPSIMWHGTVPFAAGERLTVAFDVAPPRG